MATALVIEPIFEADLEPEQYGYRPKRKAQDAVQKVHQLLNRGYREVVDADLSSYFDPLPHRELIKCVARRISDRQMLRLIKMWLKAPVQEEEGESGEGRPSRDEGTPQGAPLTPRTQKITTRFVTSRRWVRWHLGDRDAMLDLDRFHTDLNLFHDQAEYLLSFSNTQRVRYGAQASQETINLVSQPEEDLFFGRSSFQTFQLRFQGALSLPEPRDPFA